MVLPLVLAGLVGAAARFAPAVVSFVPKLVKFVVPKTPFGIVRAVVGVPIVTGVALAAPSLVKGIFDPRKGVERGKAIGEILADPSKLLPKEKPLREKVKEVAKTAGLVAGAAAAGLGVVAVAKKKIKEVKIPKLPEIKAAELPAAILPSPPPSKILEPFGAAQPTPPAEPLPAAAPAMPAISNKITFKPEINIRFSKSRKFINQQLLMR